MGSVASNCRVEWGLGVGMIVEAGEPGGSVGVDRIAFAVEKTCAATMVIVSARNDRILIRGLTRSSRCWCRRPRGANEVGQLNLIWRKASIRSLEYDSLH
jgi:hypothetical protein